MSYQFIADQHYRMPTHFGPSLGPRQGPNGQRYKCLDTPLGTYIQASFELGPDDIEQYLPPQFMARKPYQINMAFLYRTGMEWLAGRGYNEFSLAVPVIYKGTDQVIEGQLLLVVWESLADAIITGREDLGVAKLYAEIPEPQRTGRQIICRASWDGYQFAQLTLNTVQPVPIASVSLASSDAGTFHYKYMPRTNQPGIADADYVVLAPGDEANIKVLEYEVAEQANIKFTHSTFEQLPTLVHIVNALADIPYGKCVSASLVKYRGGKDLSDLYKLS